VHDPGPLGEQRAAKDIETITDTLRLGERLNVKGAPRALAPMPYLPVQSVGRRKPQSRRHCCAVGGKTQSRRERIGGADLARQQRRRFPHLGGPKRDRELEFMNVLLD
jgi:hypothetical protein